MNKLLERYYKFSIGSAPPISEDIIKDIDIYFNNKPNEILNLLDKYKQLNNYQEIEELVIKKAIEHLKTKDLRLYILKDLTLATIAYHDNLVDFLQNTIVKKECNDVVSILELLRYFKSISYVNFEKYMNYVFDSLFTILGDNFNNEIQEEISYLLYNSNFKYKKEAALILLEKSDYYFLFMIYEEISFSVPNDIVSKNLITKYHMLQRKGSLGSLKGIIGAIFELNEGETNIDELIDLMLSYGSKDGFKTIISELLINIAKYNIDLSDKTLKIILTYSPSSFIFQYKDNLPVPASFIINTFIENNVQQPRSIEYLFEYNLIQEENFLKINEYFTKFKDINTFREIIQTNSNSNTKLYESKNIIFIQNFFEKYGNNDDINFLFRLSNNKLNQASARYKYNKFKEKEINTAQSEHPEYTMYQLLGVNPAMYKGEFLTLPFHLNKLFDKEFLSKYESEVKELLDYIIQKKDYILCTERHMNSIFRNSTVLIYKNVKNKTLLDMYKEVFKSDILTASAGLKLISNIESEKDFGKFKRDIFFDMAKRSVNFAEYIKYIDKFNNLLSIVHNSGLSSDIALLALWNKGFDVSDSSNEDLLEIASMNFSDKNDWLKRIKEINLDSKKQFINEDEFSKNFDLIQLVINKFNNLQPISWKRDSSEYIALKKLHVDMNTVQNYSTIKEYIDRSKEKDKNLYNFNLDIDDLNFKVLKYLDPYAFSVGVYTNCCQRIGGAGEEAAIDSFINPLAGVLILTKNNTLISQSYFHYVPEDNGLILDNVEVNELNMKNFNINETVLSKIYADYASAIKSKYPKIEYIKCGKEYNKLSNKLFKTVKMKDDPRSFEVEDPYSDFDENNHLDLLSPHNSIKNMQVTSSNYRNDINYIIKRSDVRLLKLISLS